MGIMIFDTSYLIEYPDVVNRLTCNLVVPAIVLKQLDGLKNSEKEDVAYRARAASNAILEAQRSGRLKIAGEFKKVDMLASYADNVIVGTALKIKEKGENVILMTTDKNMKIAAASVGIISPFDNNSNTVMDRFRKLMKKIPFSWVIFCIPLFVSLYVFMSMYKIGGRMVWCGIIIVVIGFITSLWLSPAWLLHKKVHRGIREKDEDYIYDPAYAAIPGNIYYSREGE